jgi:hypothetical protein
VRTTKFGSTATTVPKAKWSGIGRLEIPKENLLISNLLIPKGHDVSKSEKLFLDNSIIVASILFDKEVTNDKRNFGRS